MSLLLQNNTAIAIAPTTSNMKNSLCSPLGSSFTFSTTPIMISTIPTIMLPATIERVDRKLTSFLLPPVIQMTSLDASILKQPPRKAPQIALRMKQIVTLTSITQKIVRVVTTPIHEQNKAYILMFLLMLQSNPVPLFSLQQTAPKAKDPTKVPALKTMGMVDLQAERPIWLRQVGIQSKKPQRMDLRRPMESRQSLFSVDCTTFLEKAKNLENLVDCYPYEILIVLETNSYYNQLLLQCFFSFTKVNTTNAIDQLNTAATIIAIYHLHAKASTKIPHSPKPIMLPRSPFADQIPIALPSVFKSKCSFVNVSKVGQAGNWKNPNTSNPIEGSIYCVKQLFTTDLPPIREVTGITRYPQQAIVRKIRKDYVRFFFPSKKKRKKKPVPNARQTNASKSPRNRLLCSKESLNSAFTCEQLILMVWRATYEVNVSRQVFHLMKDAVMLLLKFIGWLDVYSVFIRIQIFYLQQIFYPSYYVYCATIKIRVPGESIFLYQPIHPRTTNIFIFLSLTTLPIISIHPKNNANIHQQLKKYTSIYLLTSQEVGPLNNLCHILYFKKGYLDKDNKSKSSITSAGLQAISLP